MSKKKYRAGGYTHRRGRTKTVRGKTVLKKEFRKHFKKGDNELNTWVGLIKLRKSVKEVFVPIARLPKIIKHNNYLRYLNNDELKIFTSLIKLLDRDNRYYLEEFNKIGDLHKHKHGEITIDDFSELYEISDKYFLFAQSHEGTCRLTYDHIIDLLGIANERKVALEEQAKQDVANNIEEGSFTEVEDTSNDDNNLTVDNKEREVTND